MVIAPTAATALLYSSFFPLRRNIFRPGSVLTRMYRPFRVVGSILGTADCLRLVGLIRIGEFFNAFVGGVCDLREALSIP